MNIKEKAEHAAELKRQGRCNCCQAVTAVLADETELSSGQLMKLASGFAVGMGNMQATCGSLIGAVMVAGMKTDGAGTVRAARAISESFAGRCGAVTCRDLKGLGADGVFCPCDKCVENAVLAYGEVFGEK